MLAELADVVSRNKFSVTSGQIDRFLSSLVRMSQLVSDIARFRVVLEDPDDGVVLNTAYTGRAEFIVSGDRYLLELGKLKKTKIVTVHHILEILMQKQSPER
jgi:putative PIN family toxin of toxin-antitoxin system